MIALHKRRRGIAWQDGPGDRIHMGWMRLPQNAEAVLLSAEGQSADRETDRISESSMDFGRAFRRIAYRPTLMPSLSDVGRLLVARSLRDVSSLMTYRSNDESSSAL